MSLPLRIIIVEDREEDAILMSEALREAGFQPEWTQVDTEEDFRAQLNGPIDLILADYMLPQFNGLHALRIARASGRDIPFIIVSGSIGEDLAVAALQLGADDYLLKDRLTRLGPAVERALAEKQLRADKRLIEQALRDSEKRFRALIEHSADVINLLDETGRILYASPSVTHILGYAPEEQVGRDAFELIHPDDVARERLAFQELQQTPRGTIPLALRVRHQDGLWRTVEGSATNLLGEPAVSAIVVNYRDVTARKQTEVALQASEARFRSLFNTSPDAILLIDPHASGVRWPIVDCNEVACQMNGYTREELLGQSIDILNVEAGTPEARAEYFARLRREGVVRLESAHRHKDGHIFPVEISTSLFTFEGRELVLGIDRDITARRLAEEQTADALNYSRTLLEASPIGIITYRQSGEVVSVNEAAARITGATVEQLAAQNFRQLESWQRSGLLALAEQALTTQQAVEQEVHHLSTFGKEVWLNARFVPFTHKSDLHLLAMYTDITQRKQAEHQREAALQALHDSERRERERAAELQTIMNAVPAAVWIAHDQMAQVITGNRASYEMLRMTPGSNFSFTADADHAPPPYRIYQDGRELPVTDLPLEVAAATGVEISDFEEDIVLADGAVIHALGNVRPLFDESGRPRGAVGVFVDITQRRQMEEQLRILSRATEQSPASIVITDTVGNIEYVNARFTELTGYTWSEAIGQNPRILKTGHTPPEVYARLWKTIKAGAEWRGELYNRKKNGETYWESARISPICDEYGKITHFLAVKEDITERKRMLEELRRSEARFRALIENGSDLISILDTEGRFVYESPSSVRILGFEPQELIGRSALEFAHPDDLPGLQEVLNQIAQSSAGQPIPAEGRFRHKDGSWRYLETISHNWLDDPAINGIVVNARDVTERRVTEQALQRAEVSYRQLFEEMPVGLYRTTAEGEFIDVNQALIRLLGCPDRDTLLAASAASFYVSSEDRNREHEQLLRDQVVHHYETQLRRHDGAIIWVEDNMRLMRDPEGLYSYYEGSLQDITDRKERERELEAIAGVSAALRTARTHAEMLSIVLDQIYALLKVDGASIAIRDSATGESVFEAGRGTGEGYIGRRIPAGVGVIGHVIEAGRVYLTNDAQRDPTFFWPHLLGPLQAVACVPLIVQDQTIGALWIGRRTAISALELRLLEAIADIAGSAIHRAALYEAERKQRVLAESLRDTAAALSSTLNYDEVLDLILFRAQHVVPHDHARVVLIDSGKGYVVRSRGYGAATPGTSFGLDSQPHLKQVQTTARPLIISDTRDYPSWSTMPELQWAQSYVCMPIRLKGQVAGFLILASAAPGFFRSTDSERIQAFADQCAIAIDNARLYQEVSRYAEELEMRVADRTRELVEANQQLQELDRLKSKFVSDVSHELRTPVTSLSLHAELLETGKPERRDYYIKILQEQARRLNQLVEDILNLSRLELGAERVQFEPVDLNDVTASVVVAHQPSAEVAGLQLIFTPEPDLPPIQGEPNQLAQVITNLVANAINYTRQGQVQIKTYQAAQHVCVAVQDTGLGIDPEDVPHLFDRFYRGQQATRSKIRGTGLGLAIVKEIVDLHGGAITVESAVGQGSTFRISLPA
jgi:PAS domain S-box-containing protein